jgi:hypothetical protein
VLKIVVKVSDTTTQGAEGASDVIVKEILPI